MFASQNVLKIDFTSTVYIASTLKVVRKMFCLQTLPIIFRKFPLTRYCYIYNEHTYLQRATNTTLLFRCNYRTASSKSIAIIICNTLLASHIIKFNLLGQMHQNIITKIIIMSRHWYQYFQNVFK